MACEQGIYAACGDGDGAVLDARAALRARIGDEACERLASARVAIAGLGGLGSNAAVHLARSGVGHLRLVDFDCVDEGNLNRQHYFRPQLGTAKTEALAAQLRAIDPCIDLELCQVRVTEENLAALFSDMDYVVEAFDDPASKAMLVSGLVSMPEGPVVVAGNGMAGCGSAARIRTRSMGSRLWLCGDGESDVSTDGTLWAPRVALCAAQQALVVVRLILGMDGSEKGEDA